MLGVGGGSGGRLLVGGSGSGGYWWEWWERVAKWLMRESALLLCWLCDVMYGSVRSFVWFTDEWNQ
jgi:hypothetical protein